MCDSDISSCRPLPTVDRHDVCTFSGCLMDKIREVSLDMTEVVGVLTIAMDFTCLRIQIASHSRKEAYGRDSIYLCRNVD